MVGRIVFPRISSGVNLDPFTLWPTLVIGRQRVQKINSRLSSLEEHKQR